MDWASSQWKEGLPSVALQKISALEDRIEKLQKERQQKQVQFECLELTLDKEKRKVEQEKQQTVRLERELQSLADTCKNLESKHQKLQAEIQIRDSRLGNLEGQLIQAKKQSCRLQQLENDIEELKCLRENARLENQELEEKLKKEQSTIVKQGDAISDLEQTIRSLQEKSFSAEQLLVIDTNKENIDNLNSTSEDKSSDSLRKKILEQETVIKSLKEQLLNVSTKEKTASACAISSTPIKLRNSITETPSQNSTSFWDGFGGTPAKTGKIIRLQNDSSSLDSNDDEKVRTLQLKLKQVCQELECQRHNSEAAKNAMEQKLKEKENSLKAEIKQQSQTIFDMDKELKELKNKYQQDVVQSNKKLDVANMQLQKSELSKQQMEKDLKALELQINSQNTLLQQRDNELKELSKMKNSLETTTKKLQSEKRDLEQNNATLLSQKNNWAEEVRDLKLQLDGSNNLVKEKETIIQSIKKEQDALSKINLNLQNKVKMFEDLESKIKDENISLKNEIRTYLSNIEQLQKENEKITSLITTKTSELDTLKSQLSSVQKDNTAKSESIITLEQEVRSLKGYEVKLMELEKVLSDSKEENVSLKKQNQFSLDQLKLTQENMEKLQKENDRITALITAKTSEIDSLKTDLDKLQSEFTSVQTDNSLKSDNIVTLETEIKSLKESYEVKIKELEKALFDSTEENFSLKKHNETSSDQLKIMQEKMQKENDSVAALLTTKTSELDAMKSDFEVLQSLLTSVQNDNNLKTENIKALETEIKSLKENHEFKVKELKSSADTYNCKISALQEELNNYVAKETASQSVLQNLESENERILNLLNSVNLEKQAAESKLKEMESQLHHLQSENQCKEENVVQLKKEITELTENHNKLLKEFTEVAEKSNTLSTEVSELKDNLCKLKNEHDDKDKSSKEMTKAYDVLKFEMSDLNAKFNVKLKDEESLKLALQGMEAEKLNLADRLEAEIKKCDALKSELIQLKNKLIMLKTKNKALKAMAKEFNKKEESFILEFDALNATKCEAVELLSKEKIKNIDFEKTIAELNSKITNLQSELNAANESLNVFKMDAASKESYEAKLKEVENIVKVLTAEVEKLCNQVETLTVEQNTVKEALEKAEAEKKSISDSLSAETEKTGMLESNVEELKTKMESMQKRFMIQYSCLNTCLQDLKSSLISIPDCVKNIDVKNEIIVSEISNIKMEWLENELKNVSDKQLKEDLLHSLLSQLDSFEIMIEVLANNYENKITDLVQYRESASSEISKLQVKVTEMSSREEELKRNLEESLLKNLRIPELMSKEEELEISIADLSNKLEEKNEKISSLMEEMASLKTINDEQISDLQKALDAAELKSVNYDQQHLKLTGEITTLNEEIQKLHETLVEKEMELESAVAVKAENSLNMKIIENLTQEKYDLRGQISDLQKALDAAKIKISHDEQECTRLTEEISRLVQEINQLQERFSKTEMELKEENLLIQKTVENVTQENSQLKDQIFELQKALDDASELQTTIEQDCIKLKGEITTLSQEVEELQKTLVIKEMELESVSKLKNELEAQNSDLQKDLHQADIKCANLGEEHVSLTDSIATLMEEIQELQKTLAQRETELENVENLKNENSSNLKNIENLMLEKVELQGQISDLQKALDAAELKSANDTEEQIKLTAKITTLDQKIKEFQKTLIEKEMEVESAVMFKNENSLNLKKIENLVQENNELQGRISDLQKALDAAELKSIEDGEENIKLTEKVSRLVQEIDNLQEKLSKTDMELKNENLLIQETVKNLTRENDQLKNQIFELQRAIDDAAELQSTNEQEHIRLTDKITTLNQEIEQLQKTLVAKDVELESVMLKNENSANLKTIENLTLEKDELQGQISDLQKALDAAELKSANDSQEHIKLKAQIATLNQNIKEFQETLIEKEKELEDALVFKNEKSLGLKKIENLMRENDELQNQIFELQKAIDDAAELQSTSEQEHTKLTDKITELSQEVEQLQKTLVEKEVELESVMKLKTENLTNLRTIENLTLQKDELQVRISDLQKTLDAAELKSADDSQEHIKLKVEIATLNQKIKEFQETLIEKEMELEDALVLKNEKSLNLEKIENLMGENNELQGRIFYLQETLDAAELKNSQHDQEHKNLTNKISQLLQEIHQLQEKFSEIDLELKNEKSLNQTTVENLMQENSKLKNKILDHEKLTETMVKTTVHHEEYNNIMDKNLKLEEKVKSVQECLMLKEMELKKALAIKRDHLNSLKNIDVLSKEKDELQLKVSTLSQNLETAKELLNGIYSEMKNMFSKKAGIFQSILAFQKQRETFSKNLCLKTEYCMKNIDGSEEKEVEDMCQFVVHNLELVNKYLAESEVIKIPTSVIETASEFTQRMQVNLNFSKDATDKSTSRHVFGDSSDKRPTIHLEKELMRSAEVYKEIVSFEERCLSEKERLKFLVHHRLIDPAEFRKILVALKFISRFYSKIHGRKLALDLVLNSERQLFSQYLSYEDITDIISSLSNDVSVNNEDSLFFEKCLLINSYKNMYIASKLKKALDAVKLRISAGISKLEQLVLFCQLYNNVNDSHIPIIIKSDFLLFHHNISSSLWCRKEKSSIGFLNKKEYSDGMFEIGKIMDHVKVSKIPLILNCLIRLYECNLSSGYYQGDKNNFYHAVNLLMSCYMDDNSFVSPDTIKYFENFITLMSNSSGCIFKRHELKMLEKLAYSIAQDLSCFSVSFFNNRQELKRMKDLCSKLSEDIDNIKLEHNHKHTDIDALCAAFENEKLKQQSLENHIKVIENDLNTTVSKTEKLQEKIFEVTKLFSALKLIFSGSCDTIQLQSKFAALSDSFCLCEKCLSAEDELQKDKNHELFTPVSVIHFVAELFTAKTDYEKEITILKETSECLKQEIAKLESEKTILQQSIWDLEKNTNMKEHELQNLKSKYSCLENEYQTVNSLLLESNTEKDNFQKSLEKMMDSLNKCKFQYEELETDNQKIKDDITKKEHKLIECEKIIEEKAFLCDSLNIKCKDYETRIEELNNHLSSVSSNLSEANEKLTSLEKSNKLLNLTLETVEEDLQNVYSEKQKVEQSLQEKSSENEMLQQEIASLKNKLSGEMNEISDLEWTIKELKEAKEISAKECAELQNRNTKLQKDITRLSNAEKAYNVSLLEKNLFIQEKDLTIAELKERVSGSAQEKRSLETKIKNLNAELEEKVSLLRDVQNKSDTTMKEKEALEKQVADLLDQKNERIKMQQDIKNLNLKCEDLASEKKSLEIELENLSIEKCHLEKNVKELHNKISAAEEELRKGEKIREHLSQKNDIFMKDLNTLKREIRSKEKSNLENSLIIQGLKQKIEELKKDLVESSNTEKQKVVELSLLNDSLSKEIVDLRKSLSNADCTRKTTKISESHDSNLLDYHKEITAKMLEFLIDVIENVECDNNLNKLRTELLAMLSNLKNNLDESNHYNSEVHVKLQSFLKQRLNQQNELQLKVCNLTKSLSSYVTKLNQLCESVDNKHRANLDSTLLGDKSCFNDTLCILTEETVSDYSLNNVLHEMQKIFEILESHFSSMSNVISKKDNEIKSLQEKLDKMKTLMVRSPEKKQSSDSQVLEDKCKLLLSNSRKLESKHQKLLQAYNEFETRVKTLEKEKAELEAEANELAEKLKEQTSSTELLETSKMLAKTAKEIRILKQENITLKSALRQYEISYKELSMNMSKCTEQGESSQNLP